MSKGSSGHKLNDAAKRNRARYKAEDRRTRNKRRKAQKEAKKTEKKLLKKKIRAAIIEQRRLHQEQED